MKIKLLRDDLIHYLVKHNLLEKFKKAKTLFEANPLYPSSSCRIIGTET